MLLFDTKAFLTHHFDSPGNLLARYSTVDATRPSISAVEKWFQRGSIPGNQMAVLLYIIETSTGNGVKLGGFFRDTGS